nr:hypothetical protein [Streptomyces benahoarensis]
MGVGEALDLGALRGGQRLGEQGGSGDGDAGPAQAEREQGPDGGGVAGSGEPGDGGGDEVERLAQQDHRDPAEAVGEPSDQRRQRVHPGDVEADAEAHDAQVGVVVGEVDRGHRHHGDHDGVAQDDRDQAEAGGGHGAAPPNSGQAGRAAGTAPRGAAAARYPGSGRRRAVRTP